jgi:pimeloyl-ACP methyl ester carboxylesterase
VILNLFHNFKIYFKIKGRFNDPNDVTDPIVTFDRRTVWITTPTFGRIFARIAGQISAPKLVLFVHGSGPLNDSSQWNEFVPQLLEKTTNQKHHESSDECHDDHPIRSEYFCVCIDCPGYGKSQGDRQSIRSYPNQVISEVLGAFGRQQAYALVGSSQVSHFCFIFTFHSPLHHYTTTPLHHYTTTPLHHYTTTPLHHYTTHHTYKSLSTHNREHVRSLMPHSHTHLSHNI